MSGGVDDFGRSDRVLTLVVLVALAVLMLVLVLAKVGVERRGRQAEAWGIRQSDWGKNLVRLWKSPLVK